MAMKNGITLAYRWAVLKGAFRWKLSSALNSVGLGFLTAPSIRYDFELVRGGVVIDRWTTFNLVTTVGKTDIIDKYLKASGYTAAWYLGLAGAGSKVVGDTLASHAGWTELTPYSGNRPAITWGTTSGGSNTATAVSISITGTATVAGAFVCSVNTGTSGTLYSVGDFAASRGVANGDTLNVTPTLSAT
jgi:hypothetical protein